MNSIIKILAFLALPSLGWSQPFDPQSCLGFLALQFDPLNFDHYPIYFDDDSVLTLSQTGDYQGAEAIEEYVRFVSESSPFVAEKLETTRLFQGSILPDGQTGPPFGFDPATGICKFTLIESTGVVHDPDLTLGGATKYAYLINLSYSIATHKIVKWDSYFSTAFLEEFFFVHHTPAVAELICDILTGSTCQEALGTDNPEPGLKPRKCANRLARLPLADEGGYVDGNTFGCRTLHSVFAQTNSNHCAHLSLIPTEDPNGKIKCNVSAGKDPSQLFTDAEIAKLFELCAQDPELDGDTCFAIVEPRKPTSKPTTKASKKKESSKKMSHMSNKMGKKKKSKRSKA